MGGPPQAGILGGMPRVPFASNPVVTTLAASLLAGRTPNEGFANFGRALPYAMDAKMGMQQFALKQQEQAAAKAEETQRNAAVNAWVKAQSGISLSPEEAAAIQANPALGTALFGEHLKTKYAPPKTTDDITEFTYGQSNPEFNEWDVNRRSAGAPKTMGTVPPGYRVVYDNSGNPVSMEAIPGGPADTSKPDAAKAEQKERYGDVVLEDIRRAKDKVANQTWYAPVTGVGGQVLSGVGGSAAADTSQLISTIESSISFDRLQAMRESSPTGGALGAVSERELQLLSSTLGSVKQSQSQEQLLQNLDRLEQLYQDVMKKAAAYPNAADYGFSSSTPSAPNAGVFEWSPDAGLRPAQ